MTPEEINDLIELLAPVTTGGGYQLLEGEITRTQEPTEQNLAGEAG